MSFFSYKNSDCCCPGSVSASTVTSGLTERVCVQVKNVYDACMKQEQLDNKELTITDVVPVLPDRCCGPVNRPCHCNCQGGSCTCNCNDCDTPITHAEAVENASNARCLPQPCGQWHFESCRSSTTSGSITNLSIERMCDRPQFARVRGTVNIPIDVLFTDDNCQEWIGKATVSVDRDVLLAIPDESIVPFTLDSLVSAICVTGSYIGNGKFKLTICVTIVLKIIAEVELMIPTYGFCQVPPCEEYAENVCDEFFSLPLFPKQVGCVTEDNVVPGGVCGGAVSTSTSSSCCNSCGSVCSQCGMRCGNTSGQCPRCGCAMTRSN